MLLGLSIQTYYSIQHVQAAAYFVRRASRLERRSAATPGCPRLNVAIQGYASSSLFTIVAFLEALANELFADAAKSDGGHLSVLDPQIRKLIAELGQIESVEKASVMSKFDVLLRAAGLQPVPKDRTPGQDLATAIRLRNELVHYKAEWFDIGNPRDGPSRQLLGEPAGATDPRAFQWPPRSEGTGQLARRRLCEMGARKCNRIHRRGLLSTFYHTAL